MFFPLLANITPRVIQSSAKEEFMIRFLCPAMLVLVVVTQARAGFVFTTFEVPGAVSTVGTGINNAGQVVGFFDIAIGTDRTRTHGFLYAGGTFSTLDVPAAGGDVTRAWGINNTGQIVGQFSAATGKHGFLYTGGSYTTFGVPGAGGGNGTLPLAINDSGQIVGTFNPSGVPTVSGFLMTGSNFTTLEVPGGYNTVASGINDAGQIVGQYNVITTSVRHGFLYANGVFTTLNVGYVDVAAINNLGQIAGTFVDAAGQHGFLLTGSNLTIIDVPGASNTYVGGINDFGEVVGYWSANGVEGNRGFVAVSTPEPASWIGICTGAAIIAGYGWQRKRLRRDAARC